MITLDFKGPVNIEEFRKENSANFSGVYIWGFKGLIPDNKDIFVPYYVGVTAENTIHNTIINRHIKGIRKPQSTYLRLTNAFMFEFFKSSPIGFPVYPIQKRPNKQKQLNWAGWNYPNDYLKHIEYYNNIDFLNSKIGSCLTRTTDYPINLIPNLLGLSSDYLVTQLNLDNFWICYAEVNTKCSDYLNLKNQILYTPQKNKTYDLKVFEIFEAFVKFSLKGITIGKHEGNLNDLIRYLQDIEIKGCNNIFKDGPSGIFIGDYQ